MRVSTAFLGGRPAMSGVPEYVDFLKSEEARKFLAEHGSDESQE